MKAVIMVGDGENDIMAGKAAGCKTVLITDESKDIGQDMTVKSLLDFTKIIYLKGENNE